MANYSVKPLSESVVGGHSSLRRIKRFYSRTDRIRSEKSDGPPEVGGGMNTFSENVGRLLHEGGVWRTFGFSQYQNGRV